jgi:Dihydroorotate dehydrogenase
VTINISSPNTANLRTLQADAALDALLAALAARRAELAAEHGRRVPVFVKIAPDLEPAQIEAIAATLVRQHVDGVIATNTTLARDGVAADATPRRPAACRARRLLSVEPGHRSCARRSGRAFRSSAWAA